MYSFMHITSSLQYIIQPFLMIILCLLSVFVVLGNLLVVSAIWHENQLHSVTNYLIASLAAADCLVGAVVMPFSVISEIIIGSWTFGALWCDLWHSFDVLASTASIMNLCAISLDRYLAITNPISYPTKMTPKRVALLIVSLWTCSSLISFPAILWWRAVGDGSLQQFPVNITRPSGHPITASATTTSSTTLVVTTNTNTTDPISMTTTLSASIIQPNTLISSSQQQELIKKYLTTMTSNSNSNQNHSAQAAAATAADDSSETTFHLQNQFQQVSHGLHSSSSSFTAPTTDKEASQTTVVTTPEYEYKCVFTDNTYYLLFSSFISFYGPLCVMLYAYYQIYVAAVQQTRFLKHGSKQIMMSGGVGGRAGGKKAKQSRYISECINGVDLVLRAHRGGGAGAVSAATSASGTTPNYSGYSNSKNKNNNHSHNHNKFNLQSIAQHSTAAAAGSDLETASRKESINNELNNNTRQEIVAIDRSCPTIREDSENFNCDEPEATSVAGGATSSSGGGGGGCANGGGNGNSNGTGSAIKTQMLYYDSGKLVQSIVDLTAIHYIDSECGGTGTAMSSSSNINNNNNQDTSPQCSLMGGATNHTPQHQERLHIDIEQAAQQQQQQMSLLSENNNNNNNTPTRSTLPPQPATTSTSATLQTTSTISRTRTTSTSSSIVVGGGGDVGGGGGGGSLVNSITVNNNNNTSSTNIPSSNRQHRSVAKKLSKLAKERKAAKTLGIVVGVFILCWLPFFVVNIIVALCGAHCIYNFQIIMSIVTWLGWLNSAMNPVIYACWSRDFRRAFRRVLCSWVEFICPYDGSLLARKLKLKKSSNYSAQEKSHLNRNISSMKGSGGGGCCNTSSITRSGVSSLVEGGGGGGGGVVSSMTTTSGCVSGGTASAGGVISANHAYSSNVDIIDAATTAAALDHAATTTIYSSSYNSGTSGGGGVYMNSCDVSICGGASGSGSSSAPSKPTASFSFSRRSDNLIRTNSSSSNNNNKSFLMMEEKKKEARC